MHPHPGRCPAQSPRRKSFSDRNLPEAEPGAFLCIKPRESVPPIQKKAPSLRLAEGWETARLSRRQIMATGLLAAASLVLGFGKRGSWANTPYPKTIRLLQVANKREMEKYYQYMEFGRQAKEEGYKSIAYLFFSLASAELIHAQNFEKILSRLDVEISRVGKPRMTVARTRDNLMKAAKDEIDDIDSFYPHMIKEANPEGFKDAITFATFAWESEKQHRDILMKIQRWAPWFFEKVAKTIDEETDQYFVCQMCGSTMDEIPPDTCPICRFSSEHYRKIEYPT